MNYIIIALVVIVCIALFLSNRNVKPDIDREAVESEINEVYETIKEFELEAIKIVPKNIPPKTLWESKFGGTPYWPEGMAYPLDNNKKPLVLLAQINLDEAPDIKDYPSTGLLQFFVAQDDMWGLEFASNTRSAKQIIDDQHGYRVVYHEEILRDKNKLINEAPYNINNSGLPFEGEYSLVFEKFKDKVSPVDYRFEKIIPGFSSMDEAIMEELYNNLETTGCKLGGYAYFTQDDPRDYADIGDWLLLFQMDSVSEDGVDIMWGDVGVANFFIQEEDLKNKDFSRILYNWDCH